MMPKCRRFGCIAAAVRGHRGYCTWCDRHMPVDERAEQPGLGNDQLPP